MKILKIRLKSWQSHIDTTIDFNNNNINIITGVSSSGKTAIKRAIEWVLFGSDVAELDYRRWGSKETSVTIWIDNGFNVERVRSDTLNRYILRKDGCTDILFDAIGKDIPEEIQKVIQVKKLSIDGISLNLNIANQLGIPFLLEQPPSFRAKLFNFLTGNELLDLIFKFLNKENLRISKDIKSKEALLLEQESQIKEFEERYTPLKAKLNSVKELYLDLQNNIAYCEELQKIKTSLDKNNASSKVIKEKLQHIVIISDTTIQSIKKTAEHIAILEDIKINLTNTQQKEYTIRKRLNTIKIVNVDFEALKQKIIQAEELKTLSEKRIHIYDKNKELLRRQIELQGSIANTEKEIDEIKKNLPICPTCNQLICEEN